jgi:hypothetical protein
MDEFLISKITPVNDVFMRCPHLERAEKRVIYTHHSSSIVELEKTKELPEISARVAALLVRGTPTSPQ